MSSGFIEKVSACDNANAARVPHNGNMPILRQNKPRRPAHIYLKEWLEFRGLNAEQLAGRLDTSKSVVSKLINGHQRYNQDWLEEIAYALDCEVQELYRPPVSSEVREAAINVLRELAKP